MFRMKKKKPILSLLLAFTLVLSSLGGANGFSGNNSVKAATAELIIPVRNTVGENTGWTDTNVSGATYLQLTQNTSSTITPAMNFDNYTSETLSFQSRTYNGVDSANPSKNEITITISKDNGASWEFLAKVKPTSNNMSNNSFNFNLNTVTGSQVKIKFATLTASGGIGVGIQAITIKGEPIPTSTTTNTAITNSTLTNNTTLARNTDISLTFDGGIPNGTPIPGITLQKGSEAPTSVTGISILNNVVTIPAVNIARYSNYTLRIPATTFSDTSGNSYVLGDDYTLVFNTYDFLDKAISVTSTNIQPNAYDIAITSPIELTFSDITTEIDINEFTGITLSSGTTNIPVQTSILGSKLSVKPNADLDTSRDYKLTVPAQSIMDVDGNTYELTADYVLSFSTAQTSTAAINTIKITKIDGPMLTFKITANATVNATLSYQFWALDGNGWSLIKPYSTIGDNQCIWSPKLSPKDHYEVMVRIKDSYGNFCDEKVTLLTGADLKIIKIDKITTDSPNPSVGSKIFINASASGSANLLYEFWTSKDDKWELLQAYSDVNVAPWTPSKAGNYEILVRVKADGDSKVYEKSLPLEVNDDTFDFAELSGVNIIGLGEVNTPISLSANGTGDGVLNYKFTMGEHFKAAKTSTPYSTAANYPWTPTKSGIYEILTFVKESDSKNYEDRVQKFYKVTDPTLNVTLDELTLSHPDLIQQVGTTMTISANGKGSDSLQYSFWLHSDRGWNEIKTYSDSANSYEWTPERTGKYTIQVRVKDTNKSDSYEDVKNVTYTIINGSPSPIKINSLDVVGNNSKRRTKTITANAVGSENLLYEFAVVDDLFGWRTIQQYSTNSSCDWTPKKATDYRIIVRVKDSSSGSYEAQLISNYTVTN